MRFLLLLYISTTTSVLCSSQGGNLETKAEISPEFHGDAEESNDEPSDEPNLLEELYSLEDEAAKELLSLASLLSEETESKEPVQCASTGCDNVDDSNVESFTKNNHNSKNMIDNDLSEGVMKDVDVIKDLSYKTINGKDQTEVITNKMVDNEEEPEIVSPDINGLLDKQNVKTINGEATGIASSKGMELNKRFESTLNEETPDGEKSLGNKEISNNLGLDQRHENTLNEKAKNRASSSDPELDKQCEIIVNDEKTDKASSIDPGLDKGYDNTLEKVKDSEDSLGNKDLSDKGYENSLKEEEAITHKLLFKPYTLVRFQPFAYTFSTFPRGTMSRVSLGTMMPVSSFKQILPPFAGVTDYMPESMAGSSLYGAYASAHSGSFPYGGLGYNPDEGVPVEPEEPIYPEEPIHPEEGEIDEEEP